MDDIDSMYAEPSAPLKGNGKGWKKTAAIIAILLLLIAAGAAVYASPHGKDEVPEPAAVEAAAEASVAAEVIPVGEPAPAEEPAPVADVPVTASFSADGISGSIESRDGYGIITYSGIEDEDARAFIDSEIERYGIRGMEHAAEDGKAELDYPEGMAPVYRQVAVDTIIQDIYDYIASLSEPVVEPVAEPVVEPAVEDIPVIASFRVEWIEGRIESYDGYGMISYSGVTDEEAAAFLGSEIEKYDASGVAYTAEDGKAELIYAEGLSRGYRTDAVETLIADIRIYHESLNAPAVEAEDGEEGRGIHSVSLSWSPWGYEYYDFHNIPGLQKEEFETKCGFGFAFGYEARILPFLALGVETGFYGYFPTRSIIPSDSFYWQVPVLGKVSFLVGNGDVDFRIGAVAGLDISKLRGDVGAYLYCGFDLGMDFNINEDFSIFWRIRNAVSFEPHRQEEALSSNTYIAHPAMIGITYHI